MRETEPITLSSTGKFEIRLTCLTVLEAEKLISHNTTYFKYMDYILRKISNLDNIQLSKITIQEAMSLLVYYRMFFWDNMPIAEVSGKELFPSDFIGSEESFSDSIIEIGGYRFSPKILLKDAINAEKLAINSGDYKANIKRYILASGCTKNIDTGINTLNGLEANPVNLGKVTAYTEAIKKISNITVDLSSTNGTAINIVTQGGEPYALGFRGSLFFTFWTE